MSAGDLKVGDLVEIVFVHNPANLHLVGRRGTVSEVFVGLNLAKFRVEPGYGLDIRPIDRTSRPLSAIERRQLRKIDPNDDAEPRADYTPANDDDWSSAGWHPNKVRAPA
jgi:hypothetical protein